MKDKNVRKAVIYSRVSTEEQNIDNQLKQLETYCSQQNYKVTHIYTDHMSGAVTNRPQFQQMLKDARLNKFNTIVVWSLDRFSREGISNTLNYIKKLQRYNVGLKSMQESWLDTTDDGMGELFVAFLSWMAKRERQRISERTKAGLERAKAEGKKLGRPKGTKETKPRNKLNYLKRWER